MTADGAETLRRDKFKVVDRLGQAQPSFSEIGLHERSIEHRSSGA